MGMNLFLVAILNALVGVLVVLLFFRVWKGGDAPTIIDEVGEVSGFKLPFKDLKREGGRPSGPAGVESIAALGDFAPFNEPQQLQDPSQLFQANKDANGNTKYVFCLHETEKAVVVVDIPNTIEVIEDDVGADGASKSTSTNKRSIFFYQTLRNTATGAYVLSLPAFHQAAQKRGNDRATLSYEDALSHALFVHSTGRCGSTLLSKALGTACGIVSVAEPDIYSSVYVAWVEGRLTRDEVKEIVRDATYVLITNILKGLDDDRVVAIKLRGFVTPLAGIMKEAVPEAKNMFLYRQPIPTVDSYCMAFFNSGITRTLHNLGLFSLILKFTWVENFIPVAAPVLRDTDRIPAHVSYKLGIVSFVLGGWMSAMEYAFEANELGIWDAVLRYEELNEHKSHAIKKLVESLYPQLNVDEENENLKQVFTKDAHGTNAATSSARLKLGAKAPLFIQERDYEGIEIMLHALKYNLREKEYILDGTLLVSDDTPTK
eukprot:m.17982 g.17982  ORF g.17982 m.17982 type:complete len:488 (-) comp4872_c0_seq1:179-1642(-)